MKTLILVSGHLGSTMKAAKILAGMLEGGADILDTLDKPKVDFSAYDNVVFGANVRMFRLNKRFRRYAKKFCAAKSRARAFCYVMAAEEEKVAKYVEKAASLTGGAPAVYGGGVLDSTNAAGFAKTVVDSVREGLQKDGKPLPSLHRDALRTLADRIDGVRR